MCGGLLRMWSLSLVIRQQTTNLQFTWQGMHRDSIKEAKVFEGDALLYRAQPPVSQPSGHEIQLGWMEQLQ